MLLPFLAHHDSEHDIAALFNQRKVKREAGGEDDNRPPARKALHSDALNLDSR